MFDSRFCRLKGPLLLEEVVRLTGATLLRGDGGHQVKGAASLDKATQDDVSFFHNVLYREQLMASKAGVLLIHQEHEPWAPAGMAVVRVAHPLKAFTQVLQALYEEKPGCSVRRDQPSVSPEASIAEGCVLGVGVVIGPGAQVGKGCVIGPHTVIGDGVVLGEGCEIGAHVTITHALLGSGVRIKSGACLGQPGFGFFMNAEDVHDRSRQLQLGRVLVGNYTEIGANTTIDRGSLQDTVIGAYVRIDNLVQVAHNVRLEDGAVLAAQVGLSGSVRVEKGAMLGGQAGVAGHIVIHAGAKVAAQSGVMRAVKAGDYVAGSPAIHGLSWQRQNALLSRMTRQSKKTKRG